MGFIMHRHQLKDVGHTLFSEKFLTNQQAILSLLQFKYYLPSLYYLAVYMSARCKKM
jgi:hypothetical protein